MGLNDYERYRASGIIRYIEFTAIISRRLNARKLRISHLLFTHRCCSSGAMRLETGAERIFANKKQMILCFSVDRYMVYIGIWHSKKRARFQMKLFYRIKFNDRRPADMSERTPLHNISILRSL